MFAKSAVTPETDKTLHLPRILCLHGGGTNAIIFRAQCRVLERALKPVFRLCYAQAPFHSQPGPDVTSVYSKFGPFRAWLRWPYDESERVKDFESMSDARQVQESLHNAMAEDDDRGATGEWVGLLGFSQGAKVCVSLLYCQQESQAFTTISETFGWERNCSRDIDCSFRFAVLMAGRGPFVPGLIDPDYEGELAVTSPGKSFLRLPTLHVHGLTDPGLELHRELLHQYCDESSARVLEWQGHHRVAIKTKDVAALVEEILMMARDTGAL